MKPAEFWEATPHELGLMFDGYAEGVNERRKELLYLAWHVEAFARQKRLPNLKKILIDSGVKKKTNSRLSTEQLMKVAESKGLKTPKLL